MRRSLDQHMSVEDFVPAVCVFVCERERERERKYVHGCLSFL